MGSTFSDVNWNAPNTTRRRACEYCHSRRRMRFEHRGLGRAHARVVETDEPWRIAGCAIFSAALVAVYAASTLSHAIAHPKRRRLFRILDQGLIYLLIVASYTPWSLTYLRTPFWWGFLAVMWSLAIVGTVSKLALAHRIDSATVWSYLLLGWLGLRPMAALLPSLPLAAAGTVFAGGVCYSAGTIFHRWDNLEYHSHGIWHVAVIGGSLCHWYGVLVYIAGSRP